ncbi:MAG: hypothetical protein KBT75_14015 [Oleispira antarctica]|nr:hypothetical protein [Oleispira antarctica]MBQ0793836.1 hypothetical protein [Oleispira antarctica]
MFKPNTFVKATVTALTTCILMACGGDDSSSDSGQEKEKTTFSYTVTPHTFTISLPDKGARVGQNIFPVNITTNSDSDPVSGFTPTMAPMMTMAGGHKHSTPHTGCTETDADGNAECTAYFIMASVMANGDSMGTWNIDFSLPETDEDIQFSPAVKMAMGDTTLAKLKGGIDDQMPSMIMPMASMPMEQTTTTPRTYFIFNNGITGMGENRSVELFIAAKESMNNFPAITEGLILNENSDGELAINSMSDVVVKVSTDNTHWEVATSQGEGIWKSANMTSLVDTFYVSLSVNGELKTTDGEIDDGESNASAIFILSSNEMSSDDISGMDM